RALNACRARSNWEDVAKDLCKSVSGKFLQSQLHVFCRGPAHPAGSAANILLGEQIASDWKSWGIPKVQLQEFFVTLPLGPPSEGPWNEVLLTSIDGTQILHRSQNYVSVPTVQHMEDTKQHHETTLGESIEPDYVTLLPTYQAYSSNGSADGRFVFVNYARPTDLVTFDLLQQRKFGEPSLLCHSDTIAIARLQLGGRQAKVRALMNHCNCGENGKPLPGHHPSALILYPDPQDSVAPKRPVYPDGPGLPGDAPVFGHICMSHVGGGNPNTPNLPSSSHIYEENYMLPGKALTPIPVQPIGYDDAAVILSHSSGPAVPVEWKGCLASNVGPSVNCKLKVSVHNRVSAERVRCLNVIGVIPGDLSTDEVDQYVIYGNHRDAWVQGACDPGSGNIILQQIAKIFGEAYTKGFRPRRTIVLASWDGEEFSLLGSTHTVEERNLELQNRAVVYFNADCPVKGRDNFNARTDFLLAESLLTASQLVEVDPPLNPTSWLDEWLHEQGKIPGQEPFISLPGIGSDHIPFAYKLGIPSSYPEFLPDDGLFYLPVYHTAYDNIKVVEQFTDPSFDQQALLPRHRLIARLSLTMIVHMACSVRLPYALIRWSNFILDQWTEFSRRAKSVLPELPNLGINLDWITEDLHSFLKAAKVFEGVLHKFEEKPDQTIMPGAHLKSVCATVLTSYSYGSVDLNQRFPSLLNRILVNLPKQFIRYDAASHAPFYPSVLYSPEGYRYIFFPHVQSAFDKLVKDSHFVEPPSAPLCELKRQLSILSACVIQATFWLQNGLVGLDFTDS
ncbi:N-acetylated-alpha-linked acidic dipeptidase, partial [Paragonimus westermani]